MTEPRTRASNKRSATAMSTDQPAASSTDSGGSSFKSRRKTAVTPLDDEEPNASVEHRYGTVNSDMCIVMADYPQHCFRVHAAVMALHSQFFTTVATQLDANNTVYLSAGGNSSVEALDFMLNIIYNDKEYVLPKTPNRYISPGDIMSEAGSGVEAVVQAVSGLQERGDVSILCNAGADDPSDDDEDDGVFVAQYHNAHPFPLVRLCQAVDTIKPSTPLPLLDQTTTGEEMLPLLAYFDSQSLYSLLNEHIASKAYFSAQEKRVHYMRLASQYKLFAAFKQIVQFSNLCEVRMLVKGDKSSLTKAELEVVVERLA